MPTKQRGTSHPSISPSRWAVYAAAAAASALVGAPAAEAEIHYSGILNEHVVGTTVKLPLDEGFTLSFVQRESFAEALINNGTNGGFAAQPQFYGSLYASNLRRGVSLQTQVFREFCIGSSSETLTCRALAIIGNGDGNFEERGPGAIGFVFYGKTGPEYGWARIRTTGAPDYKLIVVDYAWADPGEKITVGQMSSGEKATAVKRGGSLGLLAAGGVGLDNWRRARGTDTAGK